MTESAEKPDRKALLQQLRDATREQLPKYKSHKEVRATKIKAIDFGYSETRDRTAHLLIPEDDQLEPIEVDQSFMSKHNPQAPGYFVVYPDGYESWSPVEAFESGYTKIEEGQTPDFEAIREGLAYREPIDNGDRHPGK